MRLLGRSRVIRRKRDGGMQVRRPCRSFPAPFTADPDAGQGHPGVHRPRD